MRNRVSKKCRATGCRAKRSKVASVRRSLALLAALLCGGCAHGKKQAVLNIGDWRLPESSAVIFFVDGLDREVHHQMLRAGRLANIERQFVRGGVSVDQAIVSLPSITYSNTVSILTGLFPGHHGVMGNQWFDRSAGALRDYGKIATYRTADDHFSAATIFEALLGHLTVNIVGHTHRGATVSLDNPLGNGIDWFLGAYSHGDERAGRYVDDGMRVAKKRQTWPTLALYYFPGLDETGHRYGSDSEEYREALGVVDIAIGRICDTIELQGMSDRTYFVLVTDHGHVPTPPSRSIDLKALLAEQFGWRVFSGELNPKRRERNMKRLDRYDAVVIVGAERRAAIHLPGSSGFGELPSRERIRRVIGAGLTPDWDDEPGLLALPGVDMVCSRDGVDRVRVDSPVGAAIIERRETGQQPSYRLIYVAQDNDAEPESCDFLGYRNTRAWHAILNGGWMESRDWLAATATTDYPDFVPQIVAMFDSPRAGDIVIFAKGDWAFGETYRGGHGSCMARDMRVPLYFSGPGLQPGGRLGHARIVDVMPTVLDLLGESDRVRNLQPLDGRSLAPLLRAAGKGGP